jgi:phenylalanyl-tRNA synthetase beta chain
MKLSYNWIKDYVKIKAGAEELAEKLTMTGSEVGAIEKFRDDFVMELEITSNRPDCLNMLGLAREAAAIFGSRVESPLQENPKQPDARGKEGALKFEIKDPEMCPRYTARIIKDVKVGESSGKIRERIESMGLRLVNNVVDITNFCLMESGQPLHAFDLDKIKGSKIEVRKAKKGERIVTLDGEERELDPGILVIADAEKPIAIAGVMGGKNTEVTLNTRNILLESAYFDPLSVRRTSRELGLSSDSSYRFERGVDKGAVVPSSVRAAELILGSARGVLGEFYDSGSYGEENKEVRMDILRAGNILGVVLDEKETATLLERLGMKVRSAEKGVITVAVPSFREDIHREIDLVEEVARIYGYHKVPDTVPVSAPWTEKKSFNRQVLEKTKRLLCSMGLSEIMTYSMISEKAARNFPALVKDEIKIKNPLSAEQEMLTPHLVDGMLKSIAWNINRGNKDIMFFEAGKSYRRSGEKGKFIEPYVISIGMTGVVSRNWKEGELKSDVYRLKGVVENMASRLRIELNFAAKKIDGFKNSAKITIKGKESGFFGEVSRGRLDLYGINQDVFVAEIDLSEIFSNAVLKGSYCPVQRFPSSFRDVSVLCEKTVTAARIKETAASAGIGIVERIEITDMYEGKQIPDDKKSVTLSVTYGLPDRTLTDQEIEDAHSEIKKTLSSKLGVGFR